MAQKKIHKQEAPNKKEPTPQVKKIKNMRDTGMSMREIAEMLNVSRKVVEQALAIKPKDDFIKNAGKAAGKAKGK